MPYGKKLRQVLRERNPNLDAKLSEIEEKAKSVLTYTAAAFPYYTPHDFHHSSTVEENLNWLIPDAVKHELNEWEIFFLLVAAWLHDWGMVCKSGEDPKEVREIHHRRTEDNFEKMHQLLGLDGNQGRIIGRIARGHRAEDLRGELFERQIYSANVHIDIRFLAAILRLADECDVTNSRVPEIIYYSLSPKGISEEHFKSHLSIGGIGKYVEHKIEINAVAYEPKASQTLDKLREKIQTEVDHVKGILAERKIPIEYVELHVDARGFIDKPIGFRLDEARVTQLLIGEHLYSRKDVAVRELLENSVDACRARTDGSTQIRIFLEDNKLVVQDNGIGIDYETAYKFLAQKGFSYYRSEEFKRTARGSSFDPISRWGLGILSCFLIASEVCIHTKREGKDSCKFIIPNVAEGWRYEEGSLSDSGTIVTLTLNETGRTLDLEEVLRHYVKDCPIPLYLGKDSESPLRFDWSADDPDVQKVLFEHRDYQDVEIEWDKKFEDDEVSCRYYRSRSISHIFVANQGFFVDEIRTLDQFFPVEISGIALVNSKKDIFDVDVSREKIQTNNEKFLSFREKWIQVLIGLMNEELAESHRNLAKGDDIGEVTQYHQAIAVYGLGFAAGGGWRGELKEDKRPSLPESLKDLMVSKTPYLVLTHDGIRKMHLIDLVSFKPQRILVYRCAFGRHDGLRALATFVGSVYGEKFARKDVLLLLTGGGFSEKTIREMLDALLGGTAEFLILEMTDIVRELHLDEVRTDLDSLLPHNSHFCRLPSGLRSAIVFLEPFRVKTPPIKRESLGAFDEILCQYGPSFESFVELWRPSHGEPLAPYLSHALLGRKISNFEVAKHGRLVFDFEDEFIQIMLREYGLIKDIPGLQESVKNYFLQLATLFVVPSSTAADHVAVKESEICVWLKQPKPRPIDERAGEATKVLLTMGGYMVFANSGNSEYLVTKLDAS